MNCVYYLRHYITFFLQRKAKEQKSKEIKFRFMWCSWIFYLTSRGSDTTITKFNHQYYPSAFYDALLQAAFLQRHIIATPYYRNAALSIATNLFELIYINATKLNHGNMK